MIITTEKKMRPRDANDVYVTPDSFALGSLEIFASQPFKIIVDAGAGPGAWGRAARRLWPESRLRGIELREEQEIDPVYDTWDVHSFLDREYIAREYGGVDLMIGNPPFKYAEEFVRMAMECIKPWGKIAYMLPLTFLGSMKRKNGLFREMPPMHVFVYARRPKFVGYKGGAGSEYGFFVWTKNVVSEPRIRFLEIEQ